MVEALKGADMFLGLSGGIVPEELIATMAPDGIVFALSNPDPEIHPEIAAKHAAVVATGRSDFLNQINNVLAFPGVFRGALDAGARRITEKMKVAAAEAIFGVVGDDLAPDRIVPSPLDPRVGPAVAAAVAAAAARSDRPDARLPRERRTGLRRLLVIPRADRCRLRRATPARRRSRSASTSDPESTLVAHLYAAALRFYGSPAHVRSVPDPVSELDSGDVRVVPGFTGRTAAEVRARRRPRGRTRRCTARWCPRCPKASPQATTRRRRRTSPRSRSPSGPPTRGVDAT